MRPETASALFDMRRAAERIGEATFGKNFSDFEKDWYFQSAIERQFEVLGEALARIRDFERAIFDRIPEANKIVGLRNIIIHGYDSINPAIIWTVAEERVANLNEILEELLAEADAQGLGPS